MMSDTTSLKLLKSIAESTSQLVTKISDIENKLDVTDKKISNIENKLDDTDRKISNIESVLVTTDKKVDRSIELCGASFELAARSAVRNHYGDRFARPFLIRGLYGLSRLVTYHSSDDVNEDVYLQQTNTKKLADYIFEQKLHILLFAKLAHESEKLVIIQTPYYNWCVKPLQSKLIKLFSLLYEKDQLPKSDKERREVLNKKCYLLLYGSLGLACFLCRSSPENNLQMDIEFDCRGRIVQTSHSSCLLECGEIKSNSRLLDEAREQLMLRLAICLRAFDVIYGENGVVCTGRGVIFYGGKYDVSKKHYWQLKNIVIEAEHVD